MDTQDSAKPLCEFHVKIYENEAIIDPPTGTHQITVIWLHGMTMKAADSIKFFSQGSTLSIPGLRVVLPQSPDRYNTVAAKTCPSWFDVFERTFEKPFEEVISVKEINESTDQLRKIIDREIKLLKGDSKKLFICGYSQGCGLAIHLALESEQRLGGVFAVSGYYFTITKVKESNKDVPIFIIHGKKDNIRPWDQVKSTYDNLLEIRKDKVQLETIDKMGHEYALDPIRDKFTSWIKDIMPQKALNPSL